MSRPGLSRYVIKEEHAIPDKVGAGGSFKPAFEMSPCLQAAYEAKTLPSNASASQQFRCCRSKRHLLKIILLLLLSDELMITCKASRYQSPSQSSSVLICCLLISSPKHIVSFIRNPKHLAFHFSVSAVPAAAA